MALFHFQTLVCLVQTGCSYPSALKLLLAILANNVLAIKAFVVEHCWWLWLSLALVGVPPWALELSFVLELLLCVALRALSLMTACLQASQQLGHCE